MHFILLLLLFLEQAWFAMLYFCSFGNKQLKPFFVATAIFLADLVAKSYFFPPNRLTMPGYKSICPARSGSAISTRRRILSRESGVASSAKLFAEYLNKSVPSHSGFYILCCIASGRNLAVFPAYHPPTHIFPPVRIFITSLFGRLSCMACRCLVSFMFSS